MGSLREMESVLAFQDYRGPGKASAGGPVYLADCQVWKACNVKQENPTTKLLLSAEASRLLPT